MLINLGIGVSVGFIVAAIIIYLIHKKFRTLTMRIASDQVVLATLKNHESTLQAEIVDLRSNIDMNYLHDPITGLANIFLFEDRLAQALNQSRRYQLTFAVLFLTIDDFKIVTNVLGRDAGDLLLKEVAERAKTCIRKVDTLARRNDDGFALILSQLSKAETAAFVAQRLIDTIAEPFNILDREVFVTASVGISVFPIDGDSADQLLKNADIALLQSGMRGQNIYQFYHEELFTVSRRELLLNSGLRSDSIYSQLKLYYQPQIDVEKKTIVSMEALLRWNHPDLGMIPPLDFLRLAENNGRIIAIGDWILQTSCEQLKAWHDQGLVGLTVSVNVSMKQLENSNFTYKVSQILQDHQLQPTQLVLEISESVLLPNLDQVEKTMHMLNHLGVKLAIDDFGTGYLALQHLRRFPVNYLKIDNSLTRDVTVNKETAAIIQMVVTLAHNLELKAVAEGVENDNQKNVLYSLGCHIMQGHFFGRPRVASEWTRVELMTIEQSN